MTSILAAGLLLQSRPISGDETLVIGSIHPQIRSDQMPVAAYLVKPYTSYLARFSDVTVITSEYTYEFAQGSNFIFEREEKGDYIGWTPELRSGRLIVRTTPEGSKDMRALRRRVRARSRTVGSRGTHFEVEIVANGRARVRVYEDEVFINYPEGDTIKEMEVKPSKEWLYFNTSADKTPADFSNRG